jgi:hypothetical protein
MAVIPDIGAIMGMFPGLSNLQICPLGGEVLSTFFQPDARGGRIESVKVLKSSVKIVWDLEVVARTIRILSPKMDSRYFILVIMG